MQIIEQFIESKVDNPSLCEDGIFISENYVAVIDGVTPKGKLRWEGHSSGYYAKEVIKHSLAMLTGIENSIQGFEFLNKEIYAKYKGKEDFFIENAEERIYL